MDKDELKVRKDLKHDFVHFASKCLKIRYKDGQVESFILNKAQQFIHARLEEQKRKTGKVRALILKGRQQGCSTYVGGRFYHHAIHNFGIQCFILTHELKATDNLFKMAKRFYEKTPSLIKPSIKTNNAKELNFGELDTGYALGTAENKTVGRSSTIQLFHGSEVAFWQNASDHATGIFQAIPDMIGTEIILESTANGVGNYFHQKWQEAEARISDFIAIFIPWFWQEEYRREVPDDFKATHSELELQSLYGLTDGQLVWRRVKVIELSIDGADGFKRFCQEYPCNSTEAFQLTGEDNYIPSSIVMRARKGIAEKYGPLVIGCDPARFGMDRTSIICRQGRHAFNLKSYDKKDNMEVVGILHTMIQEMKPAKVCIDMGGGSGIVDRLHELGHKDIVVGINFGGAPLDKTKYLNKRSEIWGLAKEWLDDDPCQLPDSDSLQSDLCNIKYKYNSNSQLQMEAKEEMKKRGIRSPDEGDAFCLTFAVPSSALRPSNNDSYVINEMARDFQAKQFAIQKTRK